MRLSEGLGPLWHILDILKATIRPFTGAILASPSLLLRPSHLGDLFFSILWRPMGEGIDQNTADLKATLITPNASGIVLDVGAGHGHVLKYLDKSKVTKYLALEPNEGMHQQLRIAAHNAGFLEEDGTFILLPFGAEDIGRMGMELKAHDIHPGGIDTIISILSFCSVPNAKVSVPTLINRYLRTGSAEGEGEGEGEGGKLMFFEHVRSKKEDVKWWQDAWIPVWKIFLGGCLVGQPTDDWIDAMDGWKVKERKGQEGEEESLFPHSIGYYVRA